MVYLKFLPIYNEVFFFNRRDEITGGDDSLKAFNSEKPSTMVRLFGMDYEEMKTGKIYTLDYRIQEAGEQTGG